MSGAVLDRMALEDMASPGRFSNAKFGDNIQLSPDSTTAKRIRSGDHGIVFTECPVRLGTAFNVRVLEEDTDRAGRLVSILILIPINYSIINTICRESYAGSMVV